MILYINTTLDHSIKIGIKNQAKFICKKEINSRRTQAEKLLPGIAKLLQGNKFKLSDLKGIAVASRGGSFTSLRIGVITANALGYALVIPVEGEKDKVVKAKNKKFSFSLVKPKYSCDPEIIVKSKNN